MSINSFKKNVLLVAPVVIMLTVYLVLSALVERFGMSGLLYGYFFYWGFWCIIFPLWTVGWEGFKKMFSAPGKPIARFDWLLLALPVIIYAGFRLPEVWPQITLTLGIAFGAGVPGKRHFRRTALEGDIYYRIPRKPLPRLLVPECCFWTMACCSLCCGFWV